MHVAIATENFLPKVDGIVTRNCQVARCLVEAGHRVTLVTPANGMQSYAGARIHGLRSAPLPAYPARRVALGDPRRVLDEVRPDVLHIANPIVMARPEVRGGRTNRLGVAASLAYNPVSFQARLLRRARRIGLPAVVSFHTDYFGYLDHFSLSALRPFMVHLHRHYYTQSDLTACVSRPLIDALARAGMPRVEHYRSGVDTELFHPGRRDPEMRAWLSGGSPEQPLLLYVGRLSREKDVESLRPALDALPGARLAIVGDGPQRRVLEETFRGTGTVFTGFLHGEALAAAYASADLMVFPSPNEAFGLVLLEALASGLWVVARDRLGIPETVVSGDNGTLYDTPAEMIAAIRAVLGRPGLARRARPRQDWSWASVAADLQAMYRTAMGGARAPRHEEETGHEREDDGRGLGGRGSAAPSPLDG